MKLLLTGATGYLGSHLANAFLAEGHQVVALKRRSSSLKRLQGIKHKLCFYDIESLDLARPFEEQGPFDAIVHTGTCYGRAGEPATQVFDANTVFPLRLLETAIAFNTDTFFNTDTILHPYLNTYALSKSIADWGRQLSSNDQVRFVNIRIEHIYGPGDDSSKFTTWIIDSCVKNVPEIKLTGGEQRRDFIHINDAVAAYACLLKQAPQLGPGFQEIGLGSGESVRVAEDYVEMVHRLTGSTSRMSFGALTYRDHEQVESCAEEHGLTAMGWNCATSLQDGIAGLIEEKKR